MQLEELVEANRQLAEKSSVVKGVMRRNDYRVAGTLLKVNPGRFSLNIRALQHLESSLRSPAKSPLTSISERVFSPAVSSHPQLELCDG